MQATFELTGLKMTDPKTLAKQIGSRVAQVRKEQGMTQVELAEGVRLSQQLIAEYEAGKKNIPVWRLVNIAETLGVAPEILLCSSVETSGKRGPPPRLQKQIERIVALPKQQQKSILQVLDMALRSA